MNQLAKTNQIAAKPADLMSYMQKASGQLTAALPKHIGAERMIRLAATAWSQSRQLQECSMQSIFSSTLIAAQLGLEIGVGGQAYLVPYKGKATFIPGWQGLVDLVARAGRATVWTGAVYEGDEFDYANGDRPFIKHKSEGDDDDVSKITHVYAVGRVRNAEYPIIEIFTMRKVMRHLEKYNKVGSKHYAYTNMEMYARKVALLQVLKYMPKSIELQNAMTAAHVADTGQSMTIDGEMFIVQDDEPQDQESEQPAKSALAYYTDEQFAAKKTSWRDIIIGKKKTPADLIKTAETTALLTEAQKLTIDSWLHEND